MKYFKLFMLWVLTKVFALITTGLYIWVCGNCIEKGGYWLILVFAPTILFYLALIVSAIVEAYNGNGMDDMAVMGAVFTGLLILFPPLLYGFLSNLIAWNMEFPNKYYRKKVKERGVISCYVEMFEN